MDENHLKEINGNAHQGYEPNMKRKRVDHDEVELPVCSPVIRGRILTLPTRKFCMYLRRLLIFFLFQNQLF